MGQEVSNSGVCQIPPTLTTRSWRQLPGTMIVSLGVIAILSVSAFAPQAAGPIILPETRDGFEQVLIEFDKNGLHGEIVAGADPSASGGCRPRSLSPLTVVSSYPVGILTNFRICLIFAIS